MTTLRLHIEHDGKELTFTFDKLPVRIGRDAGNECRLEFAFVSRRHCQLDLEDGRLMLRDEDSRQGTWVRADERLKPLTALDLASVGYEFQVGALHFRAEPVVVEKVARTEVIKHSPEAFTAGTVDLGGRADDAVAFRRLPPPPALSDPAPPTPVSSGAGPLETSLQHALEDYGKACGMLEDLLRQAVARDPARTSQLADGVQRLGASLRMFIATSAGIAVAAEPAQGVEGLALRHVQSLARQCVPYAEPPSSAMDVAAFVDRIGAVLATAMEGIASLRLAHRCETEGVATDPSRGLLVGRLLDWTGNRTAVDELRGELREMVTHHNRLVDEGSGDWDALLMLLDPVAMEQKCAAPRWNPFRHRALWHEFERRYDSLVRERQTLGPTFANVVRALGGVTVRRSEPPAEGGGVLRYGILAA